MRFFAELKKAYASIEAMSAVPEGGGVWIYDNFYLIKRSYSDICASSKAIRRFLKEKDSDRLLSLLDGFLFKYDFRSPFDKLLAYLRGQRYVYSSQFLSLVPVLLRALALRELGRICGNLRLGLPYSKSHLSNALDLLRIRNEEDSSALFSLWKPGRLLETAEEGYIYYDEPTVARYRGALYDYARRKGVSEFLALLRLRKAYGSLGAYVCRRSRARGLYIYALALVWLLLSLCAFCALRTWWTLLLLPTLVGCAYTVCDIVFDRFVRTRPVPRYQMNYVSEKNCTLTVITTLLTGRDDELFERLERFRIANRGPNLYFGILGDLPDAKSARLESDARVVAQAKEKIEALNAKYGGGFCLFLRDRAENKADGVFHGFERKRGAVCALVHYIKEGKSDFSTVIGGEQARRAAYVLTLDADTDLPMGGVCALLSVITHPQNRPRIENGRVTAGYGIIQPKMETTLESAALTHFSAVISGCAGLSLYQQAAFDRYSYLFGSGVFCGKGLLSVDVFYECVLGRIPDGRVLSHDMPEGVYASTLMATDIAFTDKTPKNAVSYYRRLHRWIRGDTQNLLFLKQGMGFSGVFKILSNFIGHISAVFAAAALAIFAFCTEVNPYSALLFVFLPQLLPAVFTLLRALGRLSVSRYRSFALQFSSLLLRTGKDLLYNLVAFAQTAFTSLDAICRAVWRMGSGRKLLEWVTASQEDGRAPNGLVRYIREFLPGALFGALLVFFAPAFAYKAAGALFFLFPVLAWVLARPRRTAEPLKGASRAAAVGYAREIWSFFADTVGERSGDLPVDNLQLSPTESRADRTSPTNIGLYLLAVCAANDFGFIGDGELAERVGRTVSAVERLDKYAGNLYNWYTLPGGKILGSPYVSAVDSGNFVTCLVALETLLREKSLDALAGRVRALIDATDFSVLFSEKKQLFYIGIEPSRPQPAPVYYDLLMSESRTLSYYAVSSGLLSKRHWQTLSRYPRLRGGSVGMASWSGTMFEYLMSQLLLPAPRGSFVRESIEFALREQRRVLFGGAWGISESAFFAFDSEMNYQYKASGIQSLSLKRYGEQPAILSPYSTFLALPFCPREALSNLRRLNALGARGKYGFYEALDFTPPYDGEGAPVCAYFSHHLGMSIVALANAAFGDVFVRRFMSDVRMRAGLELLEERSPTELPLRGEPPRRRERERQPAFRSERGGATDDILSPHVAVLARGPLSLIATSSGHIELRRGKLSVNVCLYDRYSAARSLRLSLTDGAETLHLSPLEGLPGAGRLFEEKEGAAAYVAYSKRLSLSLRCWIHPSEEAFLFMLRGDGAPELRAEFSFLPMLARRQDYFAHCAFSKLFIDWEYDKSSQTLIFCRRVREGEENAFCAVRLQSGRAFGYATSQDGGDGVPVNPLCRLTLDLQSGKSECVIVALGKTRGDALRAAQRAADGAPPHPARVPDGGKTQALQDAVFFPRCTEPVYAPGGRRVLWRFGISGDYPLVALVVAEENLPLLKAYLMAFRALSVRGVRVELLLITEEDDLYNRPREKAVWSLINSVSCNGFIGRRGGIFVFSKQAFTDADFAYIRAHSSYFSEIYLFEREEASGPRTLLRPIVRTLPAPSEPENGEAVLSVAGGSFTADGFCTVKPRDGRAPYSFVLTGHCFGSVVSDDSLGYTFFANSRLCRLTPFDTDTTVLPAGEKLLLFVGEDVYDAAACASRVQYRFGEAIYSGVAGNVAYTLEVLVCEKLPVKLYRLRTADGQSVKSALVIRPAAEDGSAPEAFLSFREAEGCAVFSGACYGFTGCAGEAERATDFLKLTRGVESGLCDVIATVASGRETVYFLGGAACETACTRIAAMLRAPGAFEAEREKALAFAAKLIPPMRLHSKSLPLDLMFNGFVPYQAFACRFLAKSAFYQSSGAYGFRDQLQDCLALVYADPQTVRVHLLRCCAHQYEQGDVMHWFHPFNGSGVRTRCSDDYLFLPFVTADYVQKTGDWSVFEPKVAYLVSEPLREGENERYEQPARSALRENLYLHCMRALAYAEQFGPHGLCRIGSCDWNDAFSAMGVKGRGESVFVSFFLILTLRAFEPVMAHFGDEEAISHYRTLAESLLRALDEHALCGDRYARAFCDDGSAVGVAGNEECEIDLLAQSFAAMTMGRTPETERAMFTAYEKLFDRTHGILRLFTPAFDKTRQKVGYIRSYPPGIRENGGQYTHAAVWGAKAFFSIGRPDIGLQLINALNPAARCTDPEAAAAYRGEPYVLSADIYAARGNEGRAGWSWYTGAAAWYYRVVLEDALGVHFSDGFLRVRVEPTMEYTLECAFPGGKLRIVSAAGSEVTHNGRPCSFPVILEDGENEITVSPRTDAKDL